MARRRDWDSLSADYRERLSRKGITRGKYESGVSLKSARGHETTPEHPEQAIRKPGKYPEYIRKREPRPGKPEPKPPRPKSPLQQAFDLEKARNAAFRRMMRILHGMPGAYFSVDTVEANIFGGFTAESGAVPGMTLDEARFTAKMSEDDLMQLSSPQYRGNPWWYH